MKLGTTNLQQPPNRIPHPPPGNSNLAPRVRTCPLHEIELKQNRPELLGADYAVCVGIWLRSGASHGYLTRTPLVLSSPKQNLGRHGPPRREIWRHRVDDSPASRSRAWHEGGGERELEMPPCGSSSSADCSGSGGGSVVFISAHPLQETPKFSWAGLFSSAGPRKYNVIFVGKSDRRNCVLFSWARENFRRQAHENCVLF
jgi:hypothetical protein